VQQSSRGKLSRLIAAVDGGGTKAHCYVAEFHESGTPVIIGEGIGGGCNPGTVGVDAAAREIQRAIEKARLDSASGEHELDAALFAIAGTLRPALASELQQQLQQMNVARDCRVVPDLSPIVAAVNAHGRGVALICGTGSVSAVQEHSGELHVVGGWGPLLGDEGSCFWIGRLAIAHALSILESNQASDDVTRAVLKHLNAKTIADLKQCINNDTDPRSRVASTAVVVFQFAAAGHSLANQWISAAATQLASLVQRASQRIERPLEVALAGGGFRSQILREQLAQALQTIDMDARLIHIPDPTRACLDMAAREFAFGS
jgi:glucosamine kinase